MQLPMSIFYPDDSLEHDRMPPLWLYISARITRRNPHYQEKCRKRRDRDSNRAPSRSMTPGLGSSLLRAQRFSSSEWFVLTSPSSVVLCCAVLSRVSCYPLLSRVVLRHPVWFTARLQAMFDAAHMVKSHNHYVGAGIEFRLRDDSLSSGPQGP